MKIEAGSAAPDFTLYNSEKQQVSLSDYKGKKLVLLFFPFAFSSVCTQEFCSVRDGMSTYNDLQAEVIGISVDSIYALAAFKKEYGLSFTLLSDFNKTVSQQYDVLAEQFSYGMKGVAKRAAFVVDENGVLTYAEVLDNPGNQPDFSRIKIALQG